MFSFYFVALVILVTCPSSRIKSNTNMRGLICQVSCRSVNVAVCPEVFNLGSYEG
jgi:hypothetical protein